MADHDSQSAETGDDQDVAVKSPPAKSGQQKPAPAKAPPQQLPPYKVLLHNDDKNLFEYVIKSICRIVALSLQDAELRATEADKTGVALLLMTHKERAELYQEQFTSAGLTVTIEPA